MDKVNEFEHGIDSTSTSNQRIVFDIEANLHYTYPSAKELIEKPKDLLEMITHHRTKQVPRLRMLDDYYLGYNTFIMQNRQRRDANKADHRASHNFAKYISQFITGYMTGIPIKVEHDDEDITESLIEINDNNDANALNSDLTLDLSKYGRAYELVMRNQSDEDKFYLSSVFETFVIYDTTIERKPIAAVRYPISTMGDEATMVITLYTEENNYTYQEVALDTQTLIIEDEKEHLFGEVQIIEYENNRFRQGDYENVLTLIDLYDSAQSDTANYMSDLNDALLVISGDIAASGMSSDDLIKQKQANMLILESGVDALGNKTSVTAGYIYKQYDVNGTEAYKKRLENDIHKFSNTPNLNDENFAGNSTGVAMRYKLFGLEQIRSTKERLFLRGLMKRYRLIANLKKSINETDEKADINSLKITFTPNLPEAVEEELKAFIEAGGQLSQETLLSTLSFVKSAQEEMKRIEAENKDAPMYDFQVGE